MLCRSYVIITPQLHTSRSPHMTMNAWTSNKDLTMHKSPRIYVIHQQLHYQILTFIQLTSHHHNQHQNKIMFITKHSSNSHHQTKQFHIFININTDTFYTCKHHNYHHRIACKNSSYK